MMDRYKITYKEWDSNTKDFTNYIETEVDADQLMYIVDIAANKITAEQLSKNIEIKRRDLPGIPMTICLMLVYNVKKVSSD